MISFFNKKKPTETVLYNVVSDKKRLVLIRDDEYDYYYIGIHKESLKTPTGELYLNKEILENFKQQLKNISTTNPLEIMCSCYSELIKIFKIEDTSNLYEFVVYRSHRDVNRMYLDNICISQEQFDQFISVVNSI